MYKKEYEGLALVLEIDKEDCRVINRSVLGDKSEQVTAIWDTGSPVVVISSRLAERLGCFIDTGNKREMGSSFGRGESYPTYIDLQIGPDYYPMVDAVVIDFKTDKHYDLMLGMEMIARGTLEVDSSSGNTIVTFDPIRNEDGSIPITSFELK